jgi:triacylglycerol lipase
MRTSLPLFAIFFTACGGDLLSPLSEDVDEATTAPYPILFVHGFGASARTFGFARVIDALAEDGVVAFGADLPPIDRTEVRGEVLAREIDRVLAATGAPKVHLIAHSMGGLDSRHAISALGYGDRVSTLTTISTPHRGAFAADVALGLTSIAPSIVVDALARLYGLIVSDLGADAHFRDALGSLAERNAAAFNASHPDDPRVSYRSFAGISNVAGIPGFRDLDVCSGRILFDRRLRDVMDPLLVTLVSITAHGFELRSNDGLVTVESAKWGDFRGCIGADHADEVGEIADRSANRTGFEFIRFYREVAFDLSTVR